MKVMPAALVALTMLASAPTPSRATQLETSRAAQPATAAAADSRYRISRGDTFDLIFPFVPAFNRAVTVQPDGYIALPIVGEVFVNGQTAAELETMLRQHYSGILRDPVITIALRDFEKPYFIASGEVERPGKYELRGETTVAQALAVAGGLKDKAKRSRVLVFRGTSTGGVEVTELDLKRILNQGRLERDVKLGPGDMVFVPRSRVPTSSAYLPLISLIPWFLRF